MRRSVLAALGLLALGSSALAQPAPQFGVISGWQLKQTYRAVSIGLVLPATPTDFFCIAGAAAKTISINKIVMSGTVTTAVNIPVVLLRRATLDTGGTPATGVALPVAGRMVSQNGASVATLVSYTANPTITDSSPVLLESRTLPLAAATGSGNTMTMEFGNDPVSLTQLPTIRNGGITQQLCLNAQATAATLTGNSVQITVEWTEE